MTDLQALPSWAGRRQTDLPADALHPAGPSGPAGGGRGGADDGGRSVPMAAVAAMVLLLAGVAVGAVFVLGADPDPATNEVATIDTVDGSAAGSNTSNDDTAGETDPTTAADREAEADDGAPAAEEAQSSDDEIIVVGPAPQEIVTISLTDFQLTASGTVGSEATAEAVAVRMWSNYGLLGTSELEVAPNGEQPWSAGLPDVVSRFAGLLDGELVIGPDAATVSGRSPDDATRQLVIDALSSDLGFPPLDADALVVVQLPPAEITASARAGVLTLGGVVPSERLRAEVVTSAGTTFGPDNVVDEITLDPETYARFNLARFGNNIAVFHTAGDFDIGVRGDSFYGVLDWGVTFESNSAELTAGATDLLNGFAMLINRTTLTVEVEGHTDDVGSDEANLALGEARASAVAGYLESQGVDASRLLVMAKGEREPSVPNDSDENRARNRRVVLRMDYMGMG